MKKFTMINRLIIFPRLPKGRPADTLIRCKQSGAFYFKEVSNMCITRIKELFRFKYTIKEALQMYWSDSTRQEMEQRIKLIDEEVERLRKEMLVAA